MERHELDSGIRRAWAKAEELSLAETFSKPSSLVVDPAFRDLILKGGAAYSDVYLYGLRNSYYNFILTDYSFFQFSWSGSDDVRYAYYPNPFYLSEGRQAQLRELRAMVDAEMMSEEDFLQLFRGSGAPDIRAPLIRYENAPSQYRELDHPTSHFHLGFHAENRWAIRRVLTPLAFSLLIFKQYYSSRWQIMSDSEDELGGSLERSLIEERGNCRVLGDEFFSAVELRSFHFS